MFLNSCPNQTQRSSRRRWSTGNGVYLLAQQQFLVALLVLWSLPTTSLLRMY